MNTENSSRNGKIVTFYSYKGGVGRTMALANIAFIAAMNGRRVLMVDWDLEAPGLIYYMRGLIDGAEFQYLSKHAPGLLNMLEDWKGVVLDSESVDLNNSDFPSDDFFLRYTTPINVNEPRFGTIRYLGAGADNVDGTEYADALSKLSIDELYDDAAGGYLIELLRRWSKKHFDLVLIDSRTGLADFSGICTMQIPDSVFMCFAMNRQNIDGTARVATAIRERMREAVTLRPVPMRIGRNEGSADEANAISYAVSKFLRAGLLLDRIGDSDFRSLGIPSSDAIQFNEPLVPLLKGAGTTRAFDGMVAAYLDLARRVVEDETLESPTLSQATLEDAWARLSSRRVSIEYLERILPEADPNRRAVELAELIGTLHLEFSEQQELEPEYVVCLVGALAQAIDQSFEVEDDSILFFAHLKCLDLLRELYTQSRGDWRTELVEELFRHVAAFDVGYLDASEVLSHYAEIDHLLEEVAPKSVIDWERQHLACRRATLYSLQGEGDPTESRRLVDRLAQVHEQFSAAIPPSSNDDQARNRAADVLWLRARVEALEDDWEPAKHLLMEACQLLMTPVTTNPPIQGQRIDDQRLRYEILSLLARAHDGLNEIRPAAARCLEAIDYVPEQSTARFIIFAAPIVLAVGKDINLFLERLANRVSAMESPRTRRSVAASGNPIGEYGPMFEALTSLVERATPTHDLGASIYRLADWAMTIYLNLGKRLGSSRTSTRNSRVIEVGTAMKDFAAACSRWGVEISLDEHVMGYRPISPDSRSKG